jgi:hypothetical protein
MARLAAEELLAALETGSEPVTQSLMRAKRLARLLRDQDADSWLNYELRGYPENFNFDSLGTCRRYALEGGRLTQDGKYYPKSLPSFEADCHAAGIALSEASHATSASNKVANFVEAGATQRLVDNARAHALAQRNAYATIQALLASFRSAIHSYASDCSIALALGDAAEDLFAKARESVDAFIRSRAPAAAKQLVSIAERMRDGDPESLSSAMTSCRRLLLSVADAVFPSRDVDYADQNGRKRKVGPEEYKNRLLAYLETSVSERGVVSVVETNLDHLAARLDSIYEKMCKGVHVDVTEGEARLTVINTYLFIAEIARVNAGT